MTPSPRRPEQFSGTTPIILAAGVGSRMGSATPKVLHPILGRPLAGWVVDSVRAAFLTTPIVVLSPATASLAAQLGAVSVAEQPKPLGTGDAVRCALPSLPANADEVMIACGDTPLLTSELLLALAEKRRSLGAPLAVAAFRAPDPTGYGRVILNEAECATAIVEERDADEETREIDLVNAGVYVADREWLEGAITSLKASKSGEIYLTDLVVAASNGGSPAPIVVGDAAELEGVNDRSQFADAAAALRERDRKSTRLNSSH